MITVDVGNKSNKRQTGQRFFMLTITFKTYCMHIQWFRLQNPHNSAPGPRPLSHKNTFEINSITGQIRLTILTDNRTRHCTGTWAGLKGQDRCGLSRWAGFNILIYGKKYLRGDSWRQFYVCKGVFKHRGWLYIQNII